MILSFTQTVSDILAAAVIMLSGMVSPLVRDN
jgi:hypothetical protein